MSILQLEPTNKGSKHKWGQHHLLSSIMEMTWKMKHSQWEHPLKMFLMRKFVEMSIPTPGSSMDRNLNKIVWEIPRSIKVSCRTTATHEIHPHPNFSTTMITMGKVSMGPWDFKKYKASLISELYHNRTDQGCCDLAFQCAKPGPGNKKRSWYHHQ